MSERIISLPEEAISPEREAHKVQRIFTISSGHVEEGALIEKFSLKGAGIDIPAILLGENGRGRQLGVLPIHLPEQLYRDWQEKGHVRIFAAEVGKTQAGKPKLLAKEKDRAQTNAVIVVFNTTIGFRGDNSHTGDRTGEVEKDEFWGTEHPKFHPFPGEVICRGMIAQGTAGRMGSGEQLVAVLPKAVVFRTGYSGRLYGAPAAHYYRWDGERLIALTWEERQASDLF